MSVYLRYAPTATISMTVAEFRSAIKAAQEAIIAAGIDPNSNNYKSGRKDERDYIIDALESLAYTDDQGHEIITEFKSDLIALIKDEQK